MANYHPLRDIPAPHGFKQGDVFVLFGELFSRGYANGLIDQAKAAGMTIVGITVGRREKDGELRPLTQEELTAAEENLGGKIINVPLWAGYDMDRASDGSSPSEQLSGVKPGNWQDFKLDWGKVEESKKAGLDRFAKACRASLSQIEELVPEGANLFFAHTMAGGIPKAKISLVLTNRVVKGKGDKFLSSSEFWGSEIGKLANDNFYYVTAETLRELIQASEPLRTKVEGWGGKVCYTAYGYHGTEILIQNKPQWQTYNPYLQGQAKVRLEDIAEEYWAKGIKVTAYNCPEIRTNSSDLFSGVELSLYPLVTALKNAGAGPWYEQIAADLQAKLKEGESLEAMLAAVDAYHSNPIAQDFYKDFPHWPRHNNQEIAELMLAASEAMMAMNENRKNVVTDLLSEVVVQSSGVLMFNQSFAPTAPVYWIGHDVIAKERLASQD